MTSITRKGFLAAFATASTMILTGCGGGTKQILAAGPNALEYLLLLIPSDIAI